MAKPAVVCTAEDYSGVMATNLESCFHLSQLAHPLLRNSAVAGGASIVHISSIASFQGYPGVVLYSMAKGGMNQLTRSLAAEWARDKIRVNCVAPDLVMTDMTKEALAQASARGSGGVCVVWDCSSAGAWVPWRTPNLPSQVQPAGPVVACAGGLEKHSAARRGSCPHASSNEGSEPSRSSMRRARASSKFSPWLGLGRRSASYWRWSVPNWSATKSKLPKQKLWSGWKADPARGAMGNSSEPLCSCATPMLLKIFRRQGDEYFVSDIVVGFACRRRNLVAEAWCLSTNH